MQQTEEFLFPLRHISAYDVHCALIVVNVERPQNNLSPPNMFVCIPQILRARISRRAVIPNRCRILKVVHAHRDVVRRTQLEYLLEHLWSSREERQWRCTAEAQVPSHYESEVHCLHRTTRAFAQRFEVRALLLERVYFVLCELHIFRHQHLPGNALKHWAVLVR